MITGVEVSKVHFFKDPVMAYFKALTRQSHEDNEENHDKISVGIIGKPIEIPTRHVLNTSLTHLR
jgi:hypothetical protein